MKCSSSKPVRLGLIGASNIATHVLPSIRQVANIEVLGVAAQRPGQAEVFAKKHEIKCYYNSYEACLKDQDINAVYVSVLNSDHAHVTKQCLQAGKHVLCEKPMVLKKSDAENLFKLASEKKLILLEGFMYRFHPQIQKLKELVAIGTIGETVSIRVNFSFILYDLTSSERKLRATSKACGGALSDLGCYGIDFLNSIMGNEVPITENITVRKDSKDLALDLSTLVSLKYQNGQTAIIECSVDTPSVNNWEVSGTKGSVAALRFDPQGSSMAPLYVVNEESVAKLIECASTNTFRSEFDNFAAAIAGSAAPHISAQESIQNAALLELISSNTSYMNGKNL